jgi:Uma2 family endonuclease
MALKERIYTNKEFGAFVDLPENADKLFELIDGVIIEMPSPSPLHGLIAAEILFLLKLYLKEHDIGFVVGDANDFVLAEGLVFKPDVAYISRAQMDKLPLKFEFSPDIAVEVASPSNTSHELMRKIVAYLEHGSKQVWVVYPDDKTLFVYHPHEDGGIYLRVHTATDTLDGSDVLPGFNVSVGDFFPEITS